MPAVFPNIDALETYINTYIIANGAGEITGPISNDALNGCIEFIRQSPLNWSKAAVYNNQSGDVNAPTAVVVFSGNTSPDSLSWADNIYNEYVFINMTPNDIPLLTPSFYYNLSGQAIDNIPANTAINVFKAANDLWVKGNNTGSGGGSTQKQPKSYVVGTTTGAPVADTLTWTLSAFMNSWVVLFLGDLLVDMSDSGDGTPYITKPLSSDTLTISNYGEGWSNGDKLSYILITP